MMSIQEFLWETVPYVFFSAWPLLWMILGIVFCVRRQPAAKTIVLLALAIKSFLPSLLIWLYFPMVLKGYSLGLLLIVHFGGDMLLLAVIIVAVLRYKGRRPAAVISAVLSGAALLFEFLSVVWALTAFDRVFGNWLSAVLMLGGEGFAAALLSAAGGLVFIFGTGRQKDR